MWDAGAITSTLKLNLNEFGEGVLQAENIMRMFPSVVGEFMENPLLTFVSVAKDAAEKFYDVFKDSVIESAHDAQDAWVEAQRLGVGVQWLSELQEAGKRVGLQTESLTTAITYMNRSMVMALQGEKDQIQGFTDLGFSTEFLRSHLNDTQGMFEAVFSRMQAIPTMAEKTRIAFELLGRGGADMMPLFQLGSNGIDQAIESAHQFGAVIGQEEVKSANAFTDLGAQVDEMWTGLKKQLSQPILDYLQNHTKEIHDTLIRVGNAFRTMIPAAINATAVAMVTGLGEMAAFGHAAIDAGQAVLTIGMALNTIIDAVPALANLLTLGLTPLNDFVGHMHNMHASMEKMHAELEAMKTDGTGSGVAQSAAQAAAAITKALADYNAAQARAAKAGGDHGGGAGGEGEKPVFNTRVHANVSVPFDPQATAHQVAARIAPMMKDLHRKARRDLAAQATRAFVARATGGRPSRLFIEN